MAGIFQNGIWTCGWDFIADGFSVPTSVFDTTTGSSFSSGVFANNARFTGKAYTAGGGVNSAGQSGRSFGTNLITSIVGVAIKVVTLPSGSTINPLITWYDSTAGAIQITLGVNGQGQLGFYTTGGFTGSAVSGLLGTLTSSVVVAGSYNYYEVFNTTSNTNGVLTLRLNGAQIAAFTGDTQQTANAYHNRIYFGTFGPDQYYDDCYILDTTGTAPLNTFLGPGRCLTDVPNADSATAGLNTWAFTTPQGTDWGNCANIGPNAAQYNSSGTVGQRMSLRFPAFSNITQCLFLNTWINAEEDAAGVRSITPIYRSGTSDQSGTAISLGAAFVYSNQISTINPANGQTWASQSAANASSCEIGVQVSV